MTNTPSPSRFPRPTLIGLLVVAAVTVVLVDTLLPHIAHHSPSNRIAASIEQEAVAWHASAQSAMLANRPPLNDAERRDAFTLARLAEKNPGHSMLILPPGLPRAPQDSSDSIVVVCTAAYADSPRKAFWNLWLAGPKHTVCLANGTTRLLTPAEFARLDLTGFVPLREWLSGL